MRHRGVFLWFLAPTAAAGCSSTAPADPPQIAVRRNHLAAGESETCVIRANDQVVCWGQSAPRAIQVPEAPVLMIAVGTHACLLVNDGRAFCWGDNRYGQLGDGTTQPRAQPTPVATELRFADIAAGTHSTCALTREGQLHCWGRNDFGALGVGSSGEGQRKLVPTTALTMVRFRTLGGGGTYCGLSLDQHAYCWGSVSGSFDPDTYRAPGNCSAKYYLWYVGDQCLVPTRVDTDLAFARLGSGRAADCATTEDRKSTL